MSDVEISKTTTYYADKANALGPFTLYEGIRSSLHRKREHVIATGSLHVLGEPGEVGRWLAPDYLNQGLGRSLVDTFLRRQRAWTAPRFCPDTPGFLNAGSGC